MKITLWSCVAVITMLAASAGAQFVPSGYGSARSINPPGSFAGIGFSTTDMMYYSQLRALREASALARAEGAAEAEGEAVTNVQLAVPQTSSSIDAKLEPKGNVLIQWSGLPETVNKIKFSLLDSKKNILRSKTVTSLPAEARFNMTNKSAYYRATIYHVNGTTTTVTSLL
jgi:hypothetical protein